jgi:dihydrolipoamide dehydrogenase
MSITTPGYYAIGDVTPDSHWLHVASAEELTVWEIAGTCEPIDYGNVYQVVRPEIASVGLTENKPERIRIKNW